MDLVSIVVPVFHNASSLPDLLSALQAMASRNEQYEFEFIFVDDGSKDDSLQVLHRLGSADRRVNVVKLSRNFGSTAAISAGLDCAKGESVVVISADLQDPPEIIDDMLACWAKGRRVVLAARSQRQDPWLSRMLSMVFYRLLRQYAISSMPPLGFDFFLIDRKVCDVLKQMEERNTYLMGLILWVGFDAEVLPYQRRRREKKYGRSMWTLPKKLKYFADSFVAFSYAPIRAVSLLGIFVSLLGALYAGWVVYVRFNYEYEATGWASLMVALLILSGFQILILGVMGEYIWRGLDESRGRPRYVIDQISQGGGLRQKKERRSSSAA